jgi:hypothetical protein
MSAHDILMSAAGNSNGVATYVDDVFSAYTYTGNGGVQDITTNIDTFSKGGLVWIKDRTVARNNVLYSTALEAVRNADGILPYTLVSNTTAAQVSDYAVGLKTTGFKLRVGELTSNNTSELYASWTFRKQPKFFDVVTYTGDGVAGRTVAHSLGSVPGMIIVKCTSNATMWPVYHRSLGATKYMGLNTTDASATNIAWWNNTEPTSSVFSVGTTQSTNQNTLTYVAYIFAHDAGGFGAAGTDNVISCGSFTTDGSLNATVTLGWEPQFLLIKESSTTGSWRLYDTARGLTVANRTELYAQSSAAEAGPYAIGAINATGFTSTGAYSAGTTCIYMAIRRPHKPPTTGTQVFKAIARTGTGAAATVSGVGFAPDWVLAIDRPANNTAGTWTWDKLRGTSVALKTNDTAGDTTAATSSITSFNMDGISVGTSVAINSIDTYINYFFKLLRIILELSQI